MSDGYKMLILIGAIISSLSVGAIAGGIIGWLVLGTEIMLLGFVFHWMGESK